MTWVAWIQLALIGLAIAATVIFLFLLKNKNIKVMYHPIDMQRYPMLSDDQRKKLRTKLLPKNLPEDVFICGWLGKNQFRKQNFKLWEVAHYIVHGDYIECKDCGLS